MTLTFDLSTLAASDELSFIHPMHVPIFSIRRLSVPELGDSMWSHFHHMEQSRRMRRVTRRITWGKMIHIFEIHDPNLSILFVTFITIRRRVPCYRRKIAFSHCEGYKVYYTCAVSRDLCIGGPPKPYVTILWPRIIYSLYKFYGATATTTIKGSL